MKKLIVMGALMTAVTGCATAPDKMPTAYVSPIAYENFNCSQIASESIRVSRKTADLYSSLKQEADNDAAQMAVGMLIFWPALFFLEGGDGPQAAEYSRLKGEYEALEVTSIQKECAVGTVQQFPPLPTKPKESS